MILRQDLVMEDLYFELLFTLRPCPRTGRFQLSISLPEPGYYASTRGSKDSSDDSVTEHLRE
jgi:hypothetical protein